ncbi:protein FAM98A [Bacillus rossius redtenbacheri]|uniref:protein FAM98A n=1 Tax=Bacillus rossius redtenbacheri TaxID=93214 RepID=UPI002FDCE266
MENDILDSLEDVGYAGPMLDEGGLEKALEGGPKSVEYTELVEWLSKELKVLCKLEEHVNAISSPDDSSSFLLEVSSFLKEIGCGYSFLMEGHMSERLHTRENRLLLLDFLLTELQAARMMSVNKPDTSNIMQVQLNESKTASDLKTMLIALKFPKPPANITPLLLFGKVEQKMKEVLAKASPELIGKPLFTGVLSDKQWHQLEELQAELQQEYRLRREMLIKRLDVTIQSFQWSDRVKNKEDQIASLFLSKRKALTVEPDVDLSDLLAARDDLAIIEKTSSASVRKNTQSSINKVIIGRVPDRGGRPSEQQPPPPEMPSWQQQRPGGGGGFGGGGGGGGGGFQGGRGGAERGG